MKIAVGISGGVDSAVAAFLLKEQGHEVEGVTMRIWPGTGGKARHRHACYGPGEEDEIKRADEICRVIGIPHTVIDLQDEYKKTVLDYFKTEYLRGRTPNPCIICNQKMKFGLLFTMINTSHDFDAFATGHYAQTEEDTVTGRIKLMKSQDPDKDQTYFLHHLTQKQLKRALFPLGNYTKTKVREIARKFNIPSFNDPESQDFYDGDYSELISAQEDPGDIVDSNGTVLGTHTGIWNYTIGQRRGLKVSSSEALYVKEIDAVRKRIIVTPKKEALENIFIVTHFNWVSYEKLTSPTLCTVKTRSSHRGAGCSVEAVDNTTLRVILDEPQFGLAPGQFAVLYDGDIVIGGGTIEHG